MVTSRRKAYEKTVNVFVKMYRFYFALIMLYVFFIRIKDKY